MNGVFYLAIDRLPLGLVATIEFVGTIAVAAFGLRTLRNYAALLLAAAGVFVLTELRWSSDPLGLTYAVVNALLFMAYIVLGHRIARQGASEGVSRLGAAMAAAFLFVMPIEFDGAVRAFSDPLPVLAGIGVGVASSVVPYVCDQLAMSRLARNTFALMIALLPATATVIGALVLRQIPTPRDLFGIALVMAGISLHRPPKNLCRGRLGLGARPRGTARRRGARSTKTGANVAGKPSSPSTCMAPPTHVNLLTRTVVLPPVGYQNHVHVA